MQESRGAIIRPNILGLRPLKTRELQDVLGGVTQPQVRN